MGGDGIPPLFLEHCATALVDPVYYLFSQCLSQSYLPQEWHSHLIKPIPKTGDKSQISNYHPSSLLCNLSKVLEKIVFDKIYEFISENSISIHQFSFMRNRSSLKQLILYTEFLYSSLDHHQQVDSIYTLTYTKLSTLSDYNEQCIISMHHITVDILRKFRQAIPERVK